MVSPRYLPTAAALSGTLLIVAGCADFFGRREPGPSATMAEPRSPLTAAQRYALSDAARGVPEVLQGNVIIRSAAEGPNYELFLDVKEGPGTPDGVADRLWVLQREPPRRAIRPMWIDDARVYSRRGELIVAPPVGPYALAFTLGSFPPGLLRELPADWMIQRERFLGGREVRQRFVGIGLMHRPGSWRIATDGSLPDPVSLFPASRAPLAFGVGAAIPRLACDAGGPGSSSCSITWGGSTCTTTCQEGYYACCNAGQICTCSCIAVSPGGGGGGTGGGGGGGGGCGPDAYLSYVRGEWFCVPF